MPESVSLEGQRFERHRQIVGKLKVRGMAFAARERAPALQYIRFGRSLPGETGP